MESAPQTSDNPPHEGQQYLDMIGLGELGDRHIMIGGRLRPARDFLDDPRCAAFARPALEAFSHMPEDDPQRTQYLTALQQGVRQYVDPGPSEAA